MSAINWNNGQLIQLTAGDTAVCHGGLMPGQLYAIILSNPNHQIGDVPVTLVWSNSQPPLTMIVRGGGPTNGSAICFVSGDDTSTIAVALTLLAGQATIDAFICSTVMPRDTTGLKNLPLPTDGGSITFDGFTRYYGALSAGWKSLAFMSTIDQMALVQMLPNKATVIVVNQIEALTNVYTVASAANNVLVEGTPSASFIWFIQGSTVPYTFINAVPVPPFKATEMAVQSLSQSYAALAAST